jgi:hypothetical protein
MVAMHCQPLKACNALLAFKGLLTVIWHSAHYDIIQYIYVTTPVP